MVPNTFSVDVTRYFIDSGTVNKKGNPVKFPITVRKMTINGDFLDCIKYQATVVRRKGEQYFSVKKLVAPQKKKWECPLIDKPVAPKWVKEGSFSKESFVNWLNMYFKGQGEAILSELLTAPPENQAA